MCNFCLRTVLSAVLLSLLTGPQVLWAHGSVVDSGEGCVIQFDFYSAHFSIFQPQTRQHEEFCEDLPDVTESVFVLEYRHDSLRQVPVAFRIMRNTSDLGRFVRWQDIEAMGDLSADTVFFQRVSPMACSVCCSTLRNQAVTWALSVRHIPQKICNTMPYSLLKLANHSGRASGFCCCWQR
jgi:hypothetical protein